MERSDRLNSLALVFVVLAISAMLGSVVYVLFDVQKRQSGKDQAEHQYQPAEPPKLLLRARNGKNGPNYHRYDCDNPKSEQDVTVCLQWRALKVADQAAAAGEAGTRVTKYSADASVLGVLVSSLAALLGAIATAVAALALAEAKKGSVAALRAVSDARALQRASLELRVRKSKGTYNLVARNVGGSVARLVSVAVTVGADACGPSEPRHDQISAGGEIKLCPVPLADALGGAAVEVAFIDVFGVARVIDARLRWSGTGWNATQAERAHLP